MPVRAPLKAMRLEPNNPIAVAAARALETELVKQIGVYESTNIALNLLGNLFVELIVRGDRTINQAACQEAADNLMKAVDVFLDKHAPTPKEKVH